MDARITSVLSYLSIIGWVVAYLFGDREGAKFYLNQSLVLGIASTAISCVGSLFNLGVIAVILSIILFVFWVTGFVHAIKQDGEAIPYIGEIQILK